MSSYQDIQNKINRYLDNEMSDQERHAFELECEKDPMLQDMLDGFNEHKVSAQEMEELSSSKNTKGSNGFTQRNKWILFVSGFGLAFILIVIFVQISKFSTSESSRKTAKKESNEAKNDAQKDLDTTSNVSKVNAISSNNIKAEQQKIEKANIKTIDTIQTIQIDEPLTLLPKNNVSIPENEILQSIVKKKVDIKYFNKFKAMSYDKIRRENILLVDDTELSGLPASKEDHQRTSGPLNQKVKVDYDQYIDETLKMFSQEWYYRCVERCKTILAQYPNDVNAYFYGAMSLINLKAYEEAIPYFRGVINSPYNVFYEEALFYYAMALKHIDQGKAKEVFQQITQSKSFYKERAQEQLELFKD